MASTLTGTQIKNTYQSLLKFGNNGSIEPVTPTAITDGLGNNSPLALSVTSIETSVVSASKKYGLWLDLSSNSHVSLGDYNIQYNGVSLYLSDYNKLIQTTGIGGTAKGLKLDFQNKAYSVGDFNAVDNGTSIIIDDANESINIEANTMINLKGSGLIQAASTPVANTHLKIFVNGVEYRIKLDLP